MGFISLKGIEVLAKIGVTPEERLIGRTIIVDVEIKYPLKKAGQSDHLNDTFDYGIISQAIHNHLKKEFKLMEAACRAIAGEILNKTGDIETMTITMHKLSPFLQGNVGRSVVQWHYPEDW
jgi:dihydroneopterin aldolase